MTKKIAIIGANGGIGSAFIRRFAARADVETVYSFSRSVTPPVENAKIIPVRADFTEEASVEKAVENLPDEIGFDTVICTIGMLHDTHIRPEKSLRDINPDYLKQIFAVNTIAPALAMKYFIPRLARDKKAVFAALSARIGSVSDNRIGGWHAYRASKAALNMLIKNAALETKRKLTQAVIAGLHPGTTDTALSKPFQRHVPEEKLFSPDYATEKMTAVLENLTAEDSGKIFAWDGSEIQP